MLPESDLDHPASAPVADAVTGRLRTAEETLRLIRPHLPALGITRVARQTGLDRVGLPCFAAFRPNAHSLATSAGKGLTDAAAMVSAIMEAAEQAVSEVVPAQTRAAPADLGRTSFFNPVRQLPIGRSFELSQTIGWMEGMDLASGALRLVPHDVVSLAARDTEIAGLSRSTNGLASGNSFEEASFQAVCELIERDGSTLASLRPPPEQAQKCLDPKAFEDPALDRLVEMIAAAGLVVRLFDQTSDLGIPTIEALVGPPGGGGYFDLASGAGTHPVAARAAVRAVAEAVQSRVTTIAGARDDLDDADFNAAAVPAAVALLDAVPGARSPEGLPASASFAEQWAHMRGALAQAGIDVTLVPVSGMPGDFHAVKAVSMLLEDRDANRNWRPGRRAVSLLLGAA